MSKRGSIKGHYIDGENKIKCNLPLILFKQDNVVVSYCPALDLSGYGNTETESNKSFETVLAEYFRYTLNKNTLADDLKKMGWKLRGKQLRKCPTPPTMDKLLETNKDFRHIFNKHDFQKTNKVIDIPEIA